jgi:AcrR family transcriptional regulator
MRSGDAVLSGGVSVNVKTTSVAEARMDRRRQLLLCAKQVFSTKGFHNATVADIIAKAGVARGTFYLYFSGQRDIFDSLLENLLLELRNRIRPIEMGRDSPDPLKQLKANIRRVLDLVIEEPQLIQILLRHASGLDRRSAKVVQAFNNRVLDLVERSLKHGIRVNLIRPCHTRIVAACILGTIREVTDWLTAHGSQAPPLDLLVDEIVDFGLRGLLPASAKS